MSQCAEGQSGLHERRSEIRGATVFRPVLIETEGAAHLCLVRNLSAHGMRSKVYTTFRLSETVSVQFAPGDLVPGSVIWCEDQHVGVRFAHAIDVNQVLLSAAKTEVDGKLSRPFRVPISTSCELSVDGRVIRADVLDISQRGIKVLTSYLRCGEEVIIQLRGLVPRKAVARWTHTGMAGLSFLQALPFDELARWIVELTADGTKGAPAATRGGRSGSLEATAASRSHREAANFR